MLKVLLVIAVLTVGPSVGDLLKDVWEGCEKESGKFDHSVMDKAKTVDELPEVYFKLRLCFMEKSGLVKDDDTPDHEKFAELTKEATGDLKQHMENTLECLKDIPKIKSIDDIKKVTKCEMDMMKSA